MQKFVQKKVMQILVAVLVVVLLVIGFLFKPQVNVIGEVSRILSPKVDKKINRGDFDGGGDDLLIDEETDHRGIMAKLDKELEKQRKLASAISFKSRSARETGEKVDHKQANKMDDLQILLIKKE